MHRTSHVRPRHRSTNTPARFVDLTRIPLQSYGKVAGLRGQTATATAVIAVIAVMGSTHHMVVKGQTDTLDNVARNYARCEAYMNELQDAVQSAASVAEIKAVAYNQYVENPSGPYVFCWERTPDDEEDDVGTMLLSIHPYLQPASLDDLVRGKDPAYVEQKREVILENLEQPIGTFFNYTERFNQVETQLSDVAGDEQFVLLGEPQSILGFIEEDPSNPGLLINCGCRFTGGTPLTRLAGNTPDAADSQFSSCLFARSSTWRPAG